MLNTVTIFFILNSVLFSYSSAQMRHHLNNSIHVQHCPPWSYYDEDGNECQCFRHVMCDENEAYLKTCYCLTYDDDTEVFSLALCPYFQSNGFNMTKFDKHFWYIQLPENVSDLNNYLCGTMNRRGRVCNICKDGFGPAVMSVGFEIQCSKCIGAWYGIPLYLFLELCPVTIFYLILLIFQINITSAPMTSYIMYSQIIVMALDHIYSGDMPDVTGILFAMSKQSKLFVNIVLSMYDIWNLRFFHYLMPSFCISSRLKPIHIAFLGYISVLYPLCLIITTWICVELHGRNFRPIVWLWRPFHRCFVHLRRGWNTKSDIIDVFSAFFLLSFSKGLYQILLFMTSLPILQTTLQEVHFGNTLVLGSDMNVKFGSTEHLMFAIPAIILSCIFNILPLLLLLFYPIGLFRACLSKCKLDTIALYTFVEKFYSCYRNGLDGGKDMRSFAGLSFVLRGMLFFANLLCGLFKISNNDPFFIRNIVFTTALILIGLCRPYKDMYMNVLDVLLLAQLGIMCHLISSFQGFEVQRNFVLTLIIMIFLPFAGFILVIMVRALQKVVKTHAFKVCIQKFRKLNLFSTTEQTRALVEPTVTEISYGAIH